MDFKSPLGYEFKDLKKVYEQYHKKLESVDVFIKLCEDINKRESGTGYPVGEYRKSINVVIDELLDIIRRRQSGFNTIKAEKSLDESLGDWLKVAIPGYYKSKGENYNLEEGMNQLFGESSITKNYYNHIVNEIKNSTEYTDAEKQERLDKLEGAINEQLKTKTNEKRESLEDKYQEALDRISQYKA